MIGTICSFQHMDTQLSFHEHSLGYNFLKTSPIFFEEDKLRIYALLRQLQCARSLV